MENQSLRHVSLREMGWSRNPRVFGSKPADKRAGPTIPMGIGTKGKATYGAFRQHAVPSFKKFERGFGEQRLTVSLGVRLAGWDAAFWRREILRCAQDDADEDTFR